MELEPTLTVDDDGTRRWRLNDLYHRTDGPAIERANGNRAWCLDDQLHRTDGPAVEWANGGRRWYLNGQEYTFQEWLDAMNFDEPTRLLMVLKYGT